MRSDEAGQSFKQPSLEKPPRIFSFSGDHVAKFTCPDVEKAFPCDHSEPLLFQSLSITILLLPNTTVNSLALSFHKPPMCEQADVVCPKAVPIPSLYPSASPHRGYARPILTLGAHSCRECSRCIPTRAEHREVITFLHLLAVLPLTQPRMLLACCIPRASHWLMLSLLSAKA